MTSLYCILARSADMGVIFRRGPSKHVRLIGWNLTNDRFQLGQWFNGQIYVRKSDLSPNGTKLVYFAAKHRGSLPTWIAVSTPPFLKAHVLWRGMGTWNDLSLFETDNSLALATYRATDSLVPEIGFQVPQQLQVKTKAWPGYFYFRADHDRLLRDGWTVHEGDPVYRTSTQSATLVYRKLIFKGSRTVDLDMSVKSSTKSSYGLVDSDGDSINLNADWADARGTDVVFSRGGKLLRTRVSKRNKRIAFEPAIEIADFSDMKFEAIKAPASAAMW